MLLVQLSGADDSRMIIVKVTYFYSSESAEASTWENSQELTDNVRLAIFVELNAIARYGKLPDGSVVEIATKFKTSTRTVKLIRG